MEIPDYHTRVNRPGEAGGSHEKAPWILVLRALHGEDVERLVVGTASSFSRMVEVLVKRVCSSPCAL